MPEQDSTDAAPGPGPGPGPRPGPVADEAHRLVRAAAHWLQSRDVMAAHDPAGSQPDAPDRASGPGEEADRANGTTQEGRPRAGTTQEGSGQEGSTCQDCPWCRARSAVGAPGAETLVSLAA
nr:hypothetical protein [Actinomycetota bacterium]